MRSSQELSQLHGLCFTTPRPYKPHEFESLLSGRGTVLFEQPHGFLVARFIADEAEILTLAVHPDARRKGAARQLMGSFFAHCTATGATTAFLDVAEWNTPAIALYEAHGFIETTRRTNYYRKPNGTYEDALLMICDLESALFA